MVTDCDSFFLVFGLWASASSSACLVFLTSSTVSRTFNTSVESAVLLWRPSSALVAHRSTSLPRRGRYDEGFEGRTII